MILSDKIFSEGYVENVINVEHLKASIKELEDEFIKEILMILNGFAEGVIFTRMGQ